MSPINASIACNLDPGILSAAYPLLESGKVDALEWSFDTLYAAKEIPDWFEELLTIYSQSNRLVGHGVFFSLFSGRWSAGQQAWLDALRQTRQRFNFDHITEHFGFMTGKDFHHGAPLSIPYTASTLAIGRDRLKRIQEAGACAVGLENLAFSYSLEEVKKHGDFLWELIEPVNGFNILDLHNLYCQMHNFSVEYSEIIKAYPLDRVREIHISGGSWDAVQVPASKIVRRDTHDGAVPEEVFRLLELTIAVCPQLKYIVLEQIGTGLLTAESQLAFQQDFNWLKEIIANREEKNAGILCNFFLPIMPNVPGPVVEDEQLYQQQFELSRILENAASYTFAMEQLRSSSLANSAWGLEHWAPYMLETARRIAYTWKDGFA